MIRYLLDTDVFIKAKKFHYGFDFCPAFWDWVADQNQAGKVASIEEVLAELCRGDDELKDWANDRGDEFFLKPDGDVMMASMEVSGWAKVGTYTQAAVSSFFDAADYWLVAHALGQNWTMVTHEVPGYSDNKIKIPDVCKSLEIECLNPFEMIRKEQPRFVLERKS